MASLVEVFKIDPPLLNSATPWATTIDEIRDLYNCPHTGAITIRTSLLHGFHHDSNIHQYTFFPPALGFSRVTASQNLESTVLPDESSSLNTLGYSPVPLDEYLSMIVSASNGEITDFNPQRNKPIILSVTGSPEEVALSYIKISNSARDKDDLNLMMEVNLSCPNIVDKPPPAYDAGSLFKYLNLLANVKNSLPKILCGIKTPPYTYQGQYNDLLSTLEKSAMRPGGCPISFITATNTLGSCLIMGHGGKPALASASGEGIGGMAGSALHPLALGNVSTIRKMLDTSDALRHIAIIGVGGVSDRAGYERMRGVGAAAVGVGTALGRDGIKVFEKITRGDQ